MNSERENTSGRRLFFALWPDVATRARLAAVMPALPPTALAGARPVSAQNLHLTLAFLGAVPASAEARLLGLAQDNAGLPRLSSGYSVSLSPPNAPGAPRALTLSLDTLGHWPRGGILFAAPTQTPAALAMLAADVGAMARAVGIAIAADTPFRAHVTLARRVAAAATVSSWPLPGPIVWSVNRYCLVWSRPTPTGSVYEVIASWPLLA